mmetsp:Transcript_22662/g.49663  ORF Transcript_22662/g.49663 Transcript_22662/m.49663 type:complete len:239 (-) Transcript_22662:193-909(-)
MGAGLEALHAVDTVAVVHQLSGVRVDGAAGGLQTLRGLSTPPLVAVVGAALPRAHALPGPQLRHGQLGKHAVHPPYGAQVPAPQPPLKEGRAHHGAHRDEDEQPAGQRGGVGQVPHLLPHKDGGKKCEQEGRAPHLNGLSGPLAQGGPGGQPPLLHQLPVYHEGADRAPHPAQPQVHDEDERPPPGPKEIQQRVVVPVLRPPQQQAHHHGEDVRREVEVDGVWPHGGAQEAAQQREGG